MITEFTSVIKSSKFLYLWTSQLLSQVTVQMMNFLLLARLFSVTGSSIATSLLWVAYALPTIFFGPIGAASVDLVSRRKMLMITNLLQSVTIFALVFTHQNSIFTLYAAVLIYSFLNQFYVPAENSSLPSVVSKKRLSQANSVFFMTQQVSLILGFGFAGILLKFLGFNGSLIACSIFLFIAFVSVSFLPEMRSKVKIPESFDHLIIVFLKSIYEGYQFIRSKKTIFIPFLLLLGVQISLAIIVVNLPLIATNVIHIAISYAGLAIVVPAGIGALIGSISIPRLLIRAKRKKVVVEYGLLTTGVSLLLMVASTTLLGSQLNLILVPLFLILIGLGFVMINIPTLTYLQEATPYEIRGRVFGNLWFLITIATIFPILFSGLIIEFLGIGFLLLLVGILSIVGYYFSIRKGLSWVQN